MTQAIRACVIFLPLGRYKRTKVSKETEVFYILRPVCVP